MKVKELLQHLDESVPFSWAEDWDNSGMLLGDPLDDISGIAVSLDPSLTSVKMAAEKGCSVLVTHHPLIFNPLKKIVCSEGNGSVLAFAMKKGISVICLHTNWDSSEKGVNRVIASALGLRDPVPLIPSEKGAWGLGAAGDLGEPLRAGRCGRMILETMGLSRLDLYGGAERPIRRVALCGGSGGDLLQRALWSGADAFFTADVKYHEKMDAVESGLVLFIADHGEMESFSLDALASVVSAASGTPAHVLRIPSPECFLVQ